MSNFWVLSAGRSGTASLTKYLQYAKNAQIFHEPAAGMQEYLDGYVENQRLGEPFTKTELFEGFRKEGIEIINNKGLIFGELSPMLGYVSTGFTDTYPDAKIVWVIRDPKRWIRSAIHTNIRDGDIGQCGLHWYDLQMHNLMGYAKTPRENRCMIMSETLNPRYLYKLYRWLGLAPQHQGARDWMKQDFREHRYFGPIWAPHPDDWTGKEKAEYEASVVPLWKEILLIHAEEKL